MRVSDTDKFKAICEKSDLHYYELKDGKKTYCGFYPETESGDIETLLDENDNEIEGSETLDELAKLLLNDEVLVYMHSGFEKLVCSGYAIAINNKLERKTINIQDIYEKAKPLGKNIDEI